LRSRIAALLAASLLLASGCGFGEFSKMKDVDEDESVLVIRVRAKVNDRIVNEWPPKEGERARYGFTLMHRVGESTYYSTDVDLPEDGILAFVAPAGEYRVSSWMRYEPRDHDPPPTSLVKLAIDANRIETTYRVDGQKLTREETRETSYLDYLPTLTAVRGKVCTLGDRQIDLKSSLSSKEIHWDCVAGPRGDADFRRALFAKYPGLKDAPFLPGGP